MNKLFKFFIDRPLVVNLMMILIVLMGYMFSKNMRREGLPQVDMNEIFITTIYPGASSKDVELNVTIPLEKELKGVTGIKEMTSTSMENLSKIKIKLDTDVSDKDQVKTDIRRAVDSVNTLPSEIKDKPYIWELKVQNLAVIELAFSSSTLTEKQIVSKAKEFKKELENLSLVSKVDSVGIRDREIQIKVDLDKMNANFLSFNDITQALKSQNINLAGGNLESYVSEKGIITVSRFENLQDVEKIILRSNFEGMKILLKDVARVIDTFEKKTSYIRYNGEDGVALTIVKKENADIIRSIDQIKELVEKFKKTDSAKGLTIHYLNDQSMFTRNRISIVLNNAIIGFILVVLILFLFLNRRIAFWTAMGLPVSILMSLTIMSIMGISINTISLAGIIIVLGMLVDDAIIIAENTFRHQKAGMAWKKAALQGVSEVASPVIGTVLSTIITFIPLLFLGGMIGDFVSDIPTVVTIVLLASLFEGFFILPQHLSHRKATATVHKQEQGDRWSTRFFAKVDKYYEPLLRKSLKHRYLLIAGFVVVLLGSLAYMATSMKFVMFDPDQAKEFYLVGQTKRGSSLIKTSNDIRQVEEYLKLYMNGYIPKEIEGTVFSEQIMDNLAKKVDKKKLRFYYRSYKRGRVYRLRKNISKKDQVIIEAILKRSGNRLGIIESFKSQIALNLFSGSEDPNFFSFVVYMTPPNKRSVKAAQLVEMVREKVNRMPKIEKSYFQVLSGGPPVGRELEVKIISHDDEQRIAALKDIKKLFYLPTSFDVAEFDKKLQSKIKDKKELLFVKSAYKKDDRLKKYRLKISLQKYLEFQLFGRKVLNEISKKDERLLVSSAYTEYLPEQIGAISFSQKLIKKLKLSQDIKILKKSYKLIPGKKAYLLKADVSLKSRITLKKVFKKLNYEYPHRYVLKSELKKEQLVRVRRVLRKTGFLEKSDELKLRKILDRANYMVDGVFGIDDNYEMGKDEMRVKLNYARIARYGLQAHQVASSIRTAFNGVIVTYKQTQEERIGYRVLLDDRFRRNRHTLNKLQIANNQRRLIPIRSLLNISSGKSIKRIAHFDAERSFTIGANVNPKVTTAVQVYTKLQKIIENRGLKAKYSKVKIKIKGEAAESSDTMSGLVSAFQFAIVAVYFLIVLIFGSFSQPFLVLSAIPFGIIGVIITFAVHGINFSLVAMMGVIGLSGVVINDSLVMIEFINKTREAFPDKNIIEVIIEGARKRLRPIFLTTVTTCAGLFPTAYGLGGYDIGIAPMTLAIAWGLVFATVLTLLFIPALFLVETDIRAIFKEKKFLKKKKPKKALRR